MNKVSLHPFVQRMRKFAAEEQLLPEGAAVCCALSGGADSAALLLGLLALKKPLSLRLTAVHVNHHLRGEESDRDQCFCEALCRRLNVSLHIHHCDVEGERRSQGGSVETAARTCRYRCFEKEEGLIATAHTASDNLETILQRLARGTGLHGLIGIPVRRDRYIRPMLFAARNEVEAFLRDSGQDYVTDSSNETDDYTRNRIRHRIVPLLQELNPSAEKMAFQMCRSLRRDERFLEEETEKIWQKHFQPPSGLHDLSQIPDSLRVRCMIRLLRRCGLSADGRMLQDMEALLKKGGRCQLSCGWMCRVSRDALLLERASSGASEVQKIPLRIGRNRLYEGFFLDAEVICEKNAVNHFIIDEKFTNPVLDCDKIKGNVKLRSRVPGDRIQPAGRDFTVSVKKRIQEEIPLHRRQTLHFLEDEAGTIFAEGIGAAHRVRAVPGETQRLLIIRIGMDAEECSSDHDEKE